LSPWCKVRWRVSNDSKAADAVHVDCGGTMEIFRVGRRCPGRVDGEQQAVLTASAVALSLDEIQTRQNARADDAPVLTDRDTHLGGLR
jgi:hypothetical protein